MLWIVNAFARNSFQNNFSLSLLKGLNILLTRMKLLIDILISYNKCYLTIPLREYT